MTRRTTQAFSSLIGIPYEDLDCFGLVAEFYNRLYNLEFMNIDYDPRTITQEEIKETIRREAANDEIVKVKMPDYGDIVVARFHGLPVHVGIYLGNKQMLHTMKGRNSCIERLDYKWENRIEGFYRWLKFNRIH